MEGKVLFVLVTVVHIAAVTTLDFTYGEHDAHNPTNWQNSPGWSDCGGNRQSPIDINTKILTSDEIDNDFQLSFEDSEVDGHFENNGHAPTFLRSRDSVGIWQIRSQGKVYDFRNLHFHFGVHLNKGSEHSVDGKFYPAEAHLVHTRKEEGVTSIVVIGVFISVQDDDSDEPNAELTRIVEDYIGSVEHLHATTPAEISPYAVLSDNPDFYTYSGSLTTPPCTEGVRWIIMQDPIVISQENIGILRSLYGHSELMSHDGIRRPTQRKDVPNVSLGKF